MPATNLLGYLGGAPGNVNGTSASAPLWAGFTAIINETSEAGGKKDLGFVNPLFYLIAQNPSTYAATFNDVTTGNNGVAATIGYDNVTGLGTPKCALINQIANPPVVDGGLAPPSIDVKADDRSGGPVVCMTGSGFGPGDAVHWQYLNVPGRTGPLGNGFATVSADGTFSATDATQESGNFPVCTDDQLNANVTVTVTDQEQGFLTASEQVPAYLWCDNPLSLTFGGGCGE
jgi:hypothetical protein